MVDPAQLDLNIEYHPVEPNVQGKQNRKKSFQLISLRSQTMKLN